MKKASMLFICMAAVITAIFILSPKPQRQNAASSAASISEYSTSNTSSSQESRTAQVIAPGGFLVREYHGHIGVWRNGEAVPFREYETNVSLLPEPDREALARGRTAANLCEVEKIIEDYDG